jgi:hypothetical protein
MSEILPCPFCGSNNGNSRSGHDPRISCCDCGATISGYRYMDNYKMVLTAWNRRATPVLRVPESCEKCPLFKTYCKYVQCGVSDQCKATLFDYYIKGGVKNCSTSRRRPRNDLSKLS